MKTQQIILGDFKYTGINEINVDLVITKWGHLWGIYQWDSEYRIIKRKRKDSHITLIKLGISKKQALELIKRLNLKPYYGGFRSATTWKTNH